MNNFYSQENLIQFLVDDTSKNHRLIGSTKMATGNQFLLITQTVTCMTWEREVYTYFNGIINSGSKEELKAQRPEYRDMKCTQTRQYKFYNNYIPFISQAP